MLVMKLKLGLVGLEEGLCLGVELFEDHVEIEADEDGKENANEL